MKASELRIGNYFTDNECIIRQVSSIGETAVCDCNRSRYNLIFHANPIPITEEWLIKFGLTRLSPITFLLGCYALKHRKSLDRWDVILKNGRICKLKHIHQLQNLYFALTGEELIINNHV